MLVSELTREQVQAVATPLDLFVRKGRGRFGYILMRTTADRWRQTGLGGHGACWHAYEALIDDLFEQYPDITIRTAVTTYRGAADFDARQDQVRLQVAAKYGVQGCTCDE